MHTQPQNILPKRPPSKRNPHLQRLCSTHRDQILPKKPKSQTKTSREETTLFHFLLLFQKLIVCPNAFESFVIDVNYR